MAQLESYLPLLTLFFFLIPSLTTAISSSCGGTCQTLNDCPGQLICISGKCTDDPTVGTHVCTNGSSTAGGCNSAGTLICGGTSYYTYDCSPPITSSTPALLSNNDFTAAGSGPSACDGKYHENTQPIVALSTGWYDKGSRCGNLILITAKNGKTVKAKVVDDCDSMHGYSCDSERDVEGPCANNIINGSDAVWEALGLNITDAIVEVTWTMAERVRSYVCIVTN
ncbi:kiwellin-like [Telopea speciosissima]|uniref:kiwellin-like n=1 Tax=Telopea speciosissima TaxID=54955 RepID=UPI001CC3A54D|nr:kiwellin-like [Telopea speciosissima]